jgi:hypothetical protein
VIAALIAGCAAATAVLALATDAACYRGMRRAQAGGEVVVAPFGRLHALSEPALGANPDASYHYVAYRLEPGESAVFTWTAPSAAYFSITAYTRHLQSVDGKTHHNRKTLGAHPGDAIALRLGHGAQFDIDVAGCADGVLAVRVLGGEPGEPGTLERA